MSSVPKNGDKDTKQLQSVAREELNQIEEQDPEKAQEILESMWDEAKEFLEGAGFSVPEETEVRLNPTEISKGANSSFDPQTYDINISSKSNSNFSYGDESSVFGTLVHEGVHSTQLKHINKFVDKVSEIPDSQDKGTITSMEISGREGLGDKYFWSALEAKSGDRIRKIVDHTIDEYKKWENQYKKHGNQVENTEFAELFDQYISKPCIGSTSGLDKTPEQLKEDLVSFAENYPDLLALHDISEQEYFSKVDDHVDEYAEHREKIREGRKYRDEVIERFEEAMYRELELHDIDSTEYDGHIEEVFSCFMGYCAERGLDNEEEISQYTEWLNGYAEVSDDLPEVAEQVFGTALDQESDLAAVRAGSEFQDRVLVEGDYVLSE